MTISNVKAEDIVQCDKKGVRFYAVVEQKLPRKLVIRPLDSRHTWREVSSREVVAHYRKARRNGS